VRREESASRARGSIASRDADGKAWSWRPLSEWTVSQVFERIHASGLAPHPAYADLGLSPVSCRFCIMASARDLAAAAAAPESHDLYRRMVALEIASTFAFQGSRWLGDIAPQLLTPSARNELADAKARAAQRVAQERTLTKEMLFVRGWPTRMLTDAEAELLASVRRSVCRLVGIESAYLSPDAIHRRYAELLAAKGKG
jgi:3'-phosphoadenosine 5'-phosphosulfate sulfotransferase (PAPS reductase)/FAD synthetase